MSMLFYTRNEKFSRDLFNKQECVPVEEKPAIARYQRNRTN